MKKIDSRKWQVPEYNVHEFFGKKNTYCILVPVINEGERIMKQLSEMKAYSKQVDIVIADGGSTDGSMEKSFLKKQGVRAMLTGPKGQSRQMRIGLSWALRQGYDGVITIDGNHKDNVRVIPKFIKGLDEGYDYLQGSRFIKGGKHIHTPSDRIFFNRFVISPILSVAAGKWYTDTPLAFRGYSKAYLLHPEVQPFRDIFVRYELLFYLTTRANKLQLKSKEIPCIRSYPKGQVPTKIVGWKKVEDMLNIGKIALGFYNP